MKDTKEKSNTIKSVKDYSEKDLQVLYANRRAFFAQKLLENDIGSVVFIDSEEHRDPSIRYFTGHTSDAVLIIFSDSFSVLIPWDEILAKKIASCDKVIPYTRYKNNHIDAVKAVLNMCNTHGCNTKVEMPPYLTYPDYLHFIDSLTNYDCRCKENGLHTLVEKLRMQKDEYEISCIMEAARIGDLIIDEIEKQIKSNTIKTETDVALLIEKECRKHGCEGTGFDTLAAGPSRSFAIHAFPNYTDALWPDTGLSILDFGVVVNGYTSDTTVTVAKGPLSEEQEKQLALVEKAYNECLKLYTTEHSIADAAKKAENIFAAEKRKMPHTLGHAIGLEIHEKPRVSSKTDPKMKFLPNMVLTLEPGLYSEELGGVRLENDVLIKENGNQVLTNSRIIRID